MSCECENKKLMSEQERVSELARKAAVMEGCIYVVYKKEDGTFAFDRYGTKVKGTIVEYRHYM